MYDLLIKGGQLVDGTGSMARRADVAVEAGRVVDVGKLDGSARRTIDADGALVIPGFVDIHTHYDGQATWDERLAPSAWHGVTTVVAGNCGVGFAPVRADDRDLLISLMEGIEDIPGTALHEGLDWGWQSFSDYLQVLDSRRHDTDIAVYVPHAPVRMHVMRERALSERDATDNDIEEMSAIVQAAIEAGAIGFSTTRTVAHRMSTGETSPTLGVGHRELLGIARGIARAGCGVIELITDFDDLEEEFGLLRRFTEITRRPLMISLNQRNFRYPGQWRRELGLISDASADGLPISAQVAVRPVGVLWSLYGSMNPFMYNEVWQRIAHLDRPRLVEAMRDRAFRDAVLHADQGKLFGGGTYRAVFEFGDHPDYEPSPSSSLGERALREGCTPQELAYDLLLEDDGKRVLYYAALNYDEGNLDNQRELLLDANTVIGLGDGGAHVGTICDASFPTTLLAHWGRDRRRGPTVDLPTLVKAHTRDTAAAVGMQDRGVVAPGWKADLNVIEFDALRLHVPQLVDDFPGQTPRFVQRATGYQYTILAGQVTYEAGEPTSELPGRLVRGATARPETGG